jgi:hypothetical protein
MQSGHTIKWHSGRLNSGITIDRCEASNEKIEGDGIDSDRVLTTFGLVIYTGSLSGWST